MKSIDTLVPDILALFESGRVETVASDESVSLFASELSKKLQARFNEERDHSGLRMSNLGKPCERQLWYDVNTPELGEELSSEVRVKFLYGDILESMVLWLAKEAGHTVEGEQDELNLFGIRGHRDAVIDGVLVDVKSASTRSFAKFLVGLTPEVDDFGYLRQLDAYLHSSRDLYFPDYGAFLVIDKQLGRIVLDKHPKSDYNWEVIIDRKKRMLASPTPPARAFKPEPDGKSGNMKLGVACSYCPHRFHCWPEIRTFLYSTGPRYLTEVVRLPEVPEA